MTREPSTLKMGYVLKRFPRISETFILNEILELERRGVDITIFAYLKPNEGRFHPQIANLKAKVHYLDSLDTRRWHQWISEEWPVLSAYDDRLWGVLRESLERADSVRINEIWWGAWVAAQARKLGLQHLHSHFGTMSSTVAWFASRISGIPFSFTAHAKDIYAYSMTDHRLREKLADAAKVVTVTHFNKRYMLEQAPEIDPDQIQVIHNGIDLERFKPDPSVTRENNLILSVGRLIPKKGFDDLLDACAVLKQRGVDFHCLIVGDGPEGPGLEQKRQLLGLEEHVELAGPMHQAQVLELMHRAAVFALPCKDGPDKNRDALPTVLLESLACGLPAVSTVFSGIPEIIDDGEDGFLVQPEDVDGLARRLEEILTQPDLRDTFGKRGREKAERKFDLQRNVDTLLQVFLEAAEKPQAPRRGPAGKRVVVVSADRGIPFGGNKGGSVHLREFCEALAKAGWAPAVVAAKRDRGSLYKPAYPVYTLPRSLPGSGNGVSLTEAEGYRNQGVQQLLADLQQAAGIDILYERYSLFGTGGRMFAQKHGIPFVLEVNAPLVQEAAQFRELEDVELARDVERYLFTTSDHIVTVSRELADYIRGVAPKARVDVVPNGVDVERFDAARDAGPWRKRLTADPDGDFVVGFVGRVRPWHGVEHAIDAVAAIDDPAVKLCVVGRTGELHDDLVERARAAGVGDRVRFLDAVAPDVIPQVLRAMDVVVAPYPQMDHFYFSPLKVFEYMAARRPIVASRIGQIEEILEHERTALLVPPGDAAALASAVQRLRGDTALGAQLGEAAHAEVAAKHSWGHRIATLEKLFTKLRQGAPKETYADTV